MRLYFGLTVVVKRQPSTAKANKIANKIHYYWNLMLLPATRALRLNTWSELLWLTVIYCGEVFSGGGYLNWPDDLVGNLQLIQYSRAHAYLLNHSSGVGLAPHTVAFIWPWTCCGSNCEWVMTRKSSNSGGGLFYLLFSGNRVNHWIFLDSMLITGIFLCGHV